MTTKKKETMLIGTYHGHTLDLLYPDPADIYLSDIARALTRIPRYAGHGDENYSIADHSVTLANLVPALRNDALLHDAAEAYIGDILAPLKDLVPEILRIENHILQAIRTRFGLPPKPNPKLWAYDKAMLYVEQYYGLAPKGMQLPEENSSYREELFKQLQRNGSQLISRGITADDFAQLLRVALLP